MHTKKDPRAKGSTSNKRKQTWVCPSCLTRIVIDKGDSESESRLCDYCQVPLVQDDQNHAEFRCARCKFRILTPEGLWCTRKHKFPRRYDADRCVAFVARRRRKGGVDERND